MDNKERLALADKVQKSIKKRACNYRLIQRRDKIEREFDYGNPAASIPDLMKVYEMINALPDGYWKK